MSVGMGSGAALMTQADRRPRDRAKEDGGSLRICTQCGPLSAFTAAVVLVRMSPSADDRNHRGMVMLTAPRNAFQTAPACNGETTPH